MTQLDERLLYCDEQADDDDDETWLEPETCLGDDWIVAGGAPSWPAIDPGYLSAQIRPRMRSVLFDWMQQVCQEYALCRETFHLATAYVDLYLSSHPDLAPARLQLVGVTALVLAAKLEEVHQPGLDEFAATCAGCCPVGDIVAMEQDLADALGWTLQYDGGSAPAWAAAYLQRALRGVCDAGVRRALLRADRFLRVMEIVDYSRLFVEALAYRPATLAAAALLYVYGAETIAGVAVDDACLGWIATVAGRLPFVGLRALSPGGGYDRYTRQIYHPMALQSCLGI